MLNWFGFAALCETLSDSRVKGKVGVALLPVASNRVATASLNVYWVLGIAAGSPHARTAYEFLCHCASSEQDRLLSLEGGIGCRRSTWRDKTVNQTIPFYHMLEVLHGHARELPLLSKWPVLAQLLDELTIQCLTTNISVSTLLGTAQRKAESLGL
jgi:multiple sugar transport system substrate-binding protein